MGNYISCTMADPLTKNTRATRVIFPTGEVKQYKEQVNAAELMMECPNHFLTNSKSLHIGNRISALAADEDLEYGNVYIFVPMRRHNSVVTAADATVLFVAARKISNSHDHSIRVGMNNEVPRLSLEGVDELGFGNRLSYCRSRKPLLETIDVIDRGSDQN
ncbi:hypothetical protein Fmac_001857 [Flemingia macrophylla]|uniref:Uncharacterized protein n=1 Tax=Flemingia macrophylla TaxID=520843 RepID=A0ABD1NIA2_9FABA